MKIELKMCVFRFSQCPSWSAEGRRSLCASGISRPQVFKWKKSMSVRVLLYGDISFNKRGGEVSAGASNALRWWEIGKWCRGYDENYISEPLHAPDISVVAPRLENVVATFDRRHRRRFHRHFHKEDHQLGHLHLHIIMNTSWISINLHLLSPFHGNNIR